MNALELGKQIQSGEISCIEATKAALERIQKTDQAIHAFIDVMEEEALEQAAQVQQRIDNDELTSPLAGVPMALKDNICTKDIKTTCASKILENFRPPYSATVYQRLQENGAILLGKLNMDEFAMGGSTETSYFGVTKNPWDLTRVPGGSSGGCAAAVAAEMVPYVLGSDTGGSIRQPCSFCGVSGIKPTYGAVSRYGAVALASSLDQVGPIARTIQDCGTVLEALEGQDKWDSTSMKHNKWKFTFDGDVKGLKIGIPENYFGEGLNGEVKQAIMDAAKEWEKMGATLVPLEIPYLEYAVPVFYVLCCAEASSNLSRFDGIKYGFRAEGETLQDVVENTRSQGFGMEAKRRIMLGNFVLSSGYYDAYYKKGLQGRELIRNAFNDALTKCDMILSPVAPTTAFKLGENINDPLKMYLGDTYTASVNLAGLPAVSVPCGFDGKGLPIGLQLIGRAFEEPTLVKAADAFQKQTDYHEKTPGGASK